MELVRALDQRHIVIVLLRLLQSSDFAVIMLSLKALRRIVQAPV